MPQASTCSSRTKQQRRQRRLSSQAVVKQASNRMSARLLRGQQQAGAGAVVEVEVADVGAVGQRGRVHCVVVVLRADLDAACGVGHECRDWSVTSSTWKCWPSGCPASWRIDLSWNKLPCSVLSSFLGRTKKLQLGGPPSLLCRIGWLPPWCPNLSLKVVPPTTCAGDGCWGHICVGQAAHRSAKAAAGMWAWDSDSGSGGAAHLAQGVGF